VCGVDEVNGVITDVCRRSQPIVTQHSALQHSAAQHPAAAAVLHPSVGEQQRVSVDATTSVTGLGQSY